MVKKNYIIFVSLILVAVAMSIYFLRMAKSDLVSSTEFEKHQSFITTSGEEFSFPFTHDNSNQENAKPTILVFWASWCQSCRASLLATNKLYQIYQNDIDIVGVNMQEPKSLVRAYAHEADILFPLIFDPQKVMLKKFNIMHANTYVLLNKNGQEVGQFTRDLESDDIQTLLGE